MNDAKDALMGLWKPKRITIEVRSQLNTTVVGDRFLLFQALRNVIQNAIEFSDHGSLIHIQAENSETIIKIEITDQGVGIPAFAKERIFEKFYSLERPDTKRKSSGLGLSFVKEVIELHKGTIEVKSPTQNGRGTSVIIDLPRVDRT